MKLMFKVTYTLLLGVFCGLCAAQPFSFVGLASGDSYDTINEKLVAAGFSKMMELVIQQREPINATKVRLFEGGQLVGQPARGAIVLSNNKLVGVQVSIKAEPKGIDGLFESVFTNLRARYGAPNVGFTKQEVRWGSDTVGSLVLLASPKDNEVVLHYRSQEWHLLDKAGKKREVNKF